jgi:hypothetical protein
MKKYAARLYKKFQKLTNLANAMATTMPQASTPVRLRLLFQGSWVRLLPMPA